MVKCLAFGNVSPIRYAQSLASFVTVYSDHFRRQIPNKVRHYISFSMELSIVAVLNQCSGWATIPETNHKFGRKQDNSETQKPI